MDSTVEMFSSGVHNLLDNENINKDAAYNSYNWITQDGRIKLVGGRRVVGAEGTVGSCSALWYGYNTNGDLILYRKISTKLQYLSGNTWTDILTGLTDVDYSFANYSSLAGAFTFINSTDGFWKINNANPTSPINVYSSSKNFHGKILIDKGRMILWDRNDEGKKDPTGLYGSWIDRQNSTVYTAVTSENLGASGATIYTGTLAFKAGGATRNCFALSITGTISTGVETFYDNYDGTVTSDKGGTGTINYATGAYSITFSAVTTSGNVLASYQWEDSTVHGIVDFTKSSPRVAGEGFVFPQDEGGDKIMSVVVGQDGAYYSAKQNSVYRLYIDADDANATNEVFRKDIGILSWRGIISTGSGIVFINTANPDKPELTILQKNTLGDSIEPYPILPQFKFSDYAYDTAYFETYERYVLIYCRLKNSPKNDIILMCNISGKTVDIVKYNALCSAKSSGNLYVGSPLTDSVYQIFNGFDDEGLPIDNEWTGRGELFGNERLKKEKKLRLMGTIDPDQSYQVLVSYDDGGFSLVGTVVGSGDYVDYSRPQTIGANFIGEAQIGGDDSATAYPYFCEIKIKTPKFRKRSIMFVAKGIGYIDISAATDHDILLFENRIPKRFRSKQNVSLDGTINDLPNPQF